MKPKSLIAAAVVALMPMLSHANVVYEWTATNTEAPRGVSLRLELDDRFAQGGGINFDYSGEGHISAWIPPELGLISLNFGIPNASGVYLTQDTGSAKDGRFYQFLSMHVTFGEYMTGFIEAGNFESQFKMEARNGDNVFEITDLVSDAPLDGPIGCPSSSVGPCAGATGFVRRVNEVPEPTSLALIGAGLFGASRFRRKKAA